MNNEQDLREIGRYSNDTTKAVLEALQVARSSPDWGGEVTSGLARVWRGVENQNYIDDVLEAMEQVGRSEEVVSWAFSQANDDLLGAAILASWAFQRSGSRRIIETVTRGVQTMPPTVRASFTSFYNSYLEKAAWKLSGSGAWACYPGDPARETREREEQRQKNRRFCETNELEKLVGSIGPMASQIGETPLNTNSTHGVFISYRRDGGEHLAGRVKDALKNRGLSVFMDIEDLKPGKFDEALLAKIEDSTDVVVILTPGCLDRCKNEDDWLRREIRHAIECNRNIVPIIGRGFQMPLPQELPSDIAELPKYHGLSPVSELFEASMDRLVSKFLNVGKADATTKIPPPPKLQPRIELLTKHELETTVNALAGACSQETLAALEQLKLSLELLGSINSLMDQSSRKDRAYASRILQQIENLRQGQEAFSPVSHALRLFLAKEESAPLSDAVDEWRFDQQLSTDVVTSRMVALGPQALPEIIRWFLNLERVTDVHGYYIPSNIQYDLIEVLKEFGGPLATSCIVQYVGKLRSFNSASMRTAIEALQQLLGSRTNLEEVYESTTGRKLSVDEAQAQVEMQALREEMRQR